MDAAEEATVNLVLDEIRLIQPVLDVGNGHGGVGGKISTARSTIALVDTTSLMDQPERIEDQSFIISELQRLAYHDQDTGGVQDIAEWCVAQWLRILQRSSECVEALQG
jgi:hypothetical protein